MSLSSIDVWQRISSSGLAESRQCRDWASHAARSLPASEAADGVKVLQQLVQLGYLTKYQARVVAGQLDGPLKLGSWQVLRAVGDPNWQGWFEVRSAGSSQDDSQSKRWSKSLSAEALEQLRDAAPSMEFARLQAGVIANHLQQVFEPEIIEEGLLLHVAPAIGKPLSKQNHGKPLASDVANTIIQQVGSALSMMHEAGVVHACLRVDSIYWDGAHALLTRDPLCRHAASFDGRVAGVMGQSVDALSAAQFLAPEFLAPGARATAGTDVYALGCLWWLLLTGAAVSPGKSPQQVLAAAAQREPKLPKQVALAPSIERVLRYALGKRPSSRFASARAFCQAFDAALELERLAESPATTRTSREKRQATLAAEVPGPTTSSEAAAAEATVAEANVDKATATEMPAFVGTETGGRSRKVRDSRVLPAQDDRSRPPERKARRRQRGNGRWMLPIMGGCGLLILLLLTLHFSGVLRQVVSNETANRKTPPFVSDRPSASDPVANQSFATQPSSDWLTEHYVLVDDSKSALWAPPAMPVPLGLELLPPGGQCFVALRPEGLIRSGLLDALGDAIGSSTAHSMQDLVNLAGVNLQEMRRCTFAFYTAESSESIPSFCMRVDLAEGQELPDLLAAWENPEKQEALNPSLFVNGDIAYFAGQPESKSLITSFSVGPTGLMREVAEIDGNEGPLLPQMEKLRRASDSLADFVILLSPPYLFTEGRGLLALLPAKMRGYIPEVIGTDSRAALLQTRLSPTWYSEVQLIGRNEQHAGRLVTQLEKQVRDLPDNVEQWLVDETPHPYWKALALRYPQMLRSMADFTRFGVEDGVSVMNTYLPATASKNLLLASWIAVQDQSTTANGSSGQPAADRPQPLTIEEYLARRIKVSFDLEPIENALQLVAEEANSGLPAGSKPLRFELDGDAFETAGITRNQGLSDFRQLNSSVREALTEIARRGNPVTTVTDTRDEDQQLIWVVKNDSQTPGQQMISLTTRVAARAAGIELPIEFAP